MYSLHLVNLQVQDAFPFSIALSWKGSAPESEEGSPGINAISHENVANGHATYETTAHGHDENDSPPEKKMPYGPKGTEGRLTRLGLNRVLSVRARVFVASIGSLGNDFLQRPPIGETSPAMGAAKEAHS